MFYYIPPAFHPVFLNVICLIACLGTYFQAHEENNELTEKGKVPFISDLGNGKIAGAIFSLFFSLYIFIAFIVMTIRFEQVKSKYRFNDQRCLQVANVAIYGTGLMSCTGLWMLINFREEKNDMVMLNVHMAGKWIAYPMGLFYALMQSLFSAFWRDLEGRSLCVIITRAVISAVHLALLIAYIALQESNMKNILDKIPEKDAPVIDWILIFLPSIFSLTFIPEFYKFGTKLKIEYPNEGGIYGIGVQGGTHMAPLHSGIEEEPETSTRDADNMDENAQLINNSDDDDPLQ